MLLNKNLDEIRRSDFTSENLINIVEFDRENLFVSSCDTLLFANDKLQLIK